MTRLPILIPEDFYPVVQINDKVTPHQTIAKRKVSEQAINIAGLLSADSNSLRKMVKKNPGDQVAPGDVLAKKQTLLGLKHEAIHSKVAGQVARFERDSGTLVLSVDNTKADTISEKDQLFSPVEGTVTLCDNNEIVINTDQDVVIGTKGYGGIRDGILTSVITTDPASFDKTVMSDAIDGTIANKILLSGLVPQNTLVKALAIGIVGIITTQLTEEIITYLEEKNMHTPVIEIKKDDIQRLLTWAGKKICISGSTNVIMLLPQ